MGQATIGRMLRFAGLSGLGWLLDVAILLTLVGSGAMPAFGANLVSAGIAASGVFLLSRRFVFRRNRRHVAVRLGAYLLYTVGVIFAAAACLQALVGLLSAHLAAAPVVLAFVAKVIVTPPQLLLNFCVARLLSERPLGMEASPWPTRS